MGNSITAYLSGQYRGSLNEGKREDGQPKKRTVIALSLGR